ncbi:hypothetical protein OSSY52_00330 [Tepiditoga spiralis]|uniref:Helix-turn-helix domain-containing protein n=1 Tax=Tepiditoga spiralis TaxID=2108365 RepID=A0A7G1G797_9BACT|nr:helix-turn-helix domain-containing protein [Tepiditoga spiralis]BBE29892.1 hypothetical protein OSSY52_00330 [Tepiditoga spiralis]
MKLYTVDEVAKITGVSSYMVLKWVSEDKLKTVFKDNETFISEESLNEFQKNTNIKLLKPSESMKIFSMNKPNNKSENKQNTKNKKGVLELLEEYRKENNVMSPEEIESLFNSKK